MTSKYGVALPLETYNGWPLRVGDFAAHGKLEGLVAANDAVLVWSGGASDVTLQVRTSKGTQRHEFSRQGGMIDLLPRGTTFDEVSWRGQPSQCVSVAFDADRVERLLGKRCELRPEALRTAVTDAHVVDLVRRLQAQALSGQPWGALYVEALSLTLASYVYGRYAVELESESSSGFLPTLQSERLFAFVEDHLG